MSPKLVRIWIVVSLAAWALGYVLKMRDGDDFASIVYFFGWVSSLLAIGYYSTPSGSFGKIAFVFVVIIVAGIVFKMLHLVGANLMIIVGLAGIAIVYALMWLRDRKSTS